MSAAAATASILASALVAGLFVRVGLVFVSGPVGPPGARLARLAFACWWWGLAVNTATGAVLTGLSTAASPPLALVSGVSLLGIGSVCVGLAGLLYYLAYLVSGSQGWFWPIVLGYAAICAWLWQASAAWDASGLVVAGWKATVTYHLAPSGPTVLLMLAVLIGPQLVAAVALAVVAMRLPRGPVRVRAGVLAGAILAWFGSSTIGSVAGAHGAAWSILQEVIGVMVGLAVLSAYGRTRDLPDRPEANAGRPSRDDAESAAHEGA